MGQFLAQQIGAEVERPPPLFAFGDRIWNYKSIFGCYAQGMQWKEIFVFPFRRPSILIKLWLLHLTPMLALIPLFISGAVTMLGGALSAYRHSPGDAPNLLDSAVTAMGAGTFVCYLFFIAVALFCGMYPFGYLLDVARSVAQENPPQPLPLGRWAARFAKGIYGFLLFYPALLLMVLPLTVVIGGLSWSVVACAAPLLRQHEGVVLVLALGAEVCGVVAMAALMMFTIMGTWLRLGRSLNPFWVLNPFGIIGDFLRGWKDYIAMMVLCLSAYLLLWTATMTLMLVAPFFLGGPLILLPSLFLGIAQNYFLLASAHAGGQYARLYLR